MGGVAATRIARWDGWIWSPLADGLGTSIGRSVDDIHLAPSGKLYVGGRFGYDNVGKRYNNVASWDGSAWSALCNGVAGAVDAIHFHDGSLWVGGIFDSATGPVSYRLARWLEP